MKTVRNRKGAILLFILIIHAVLILTTTVLLSTVTKDFKMKKIHSKVKKALYHAESGLDEAYAITHGFLSDAIIYLSECEEEQGNINIKKEFIDIIEGKAKCNEKKVSLVSVLQNKNNYIMNEANNLTITASLVIKGSSYILNLKSTYKIDKIVRSVSTEYVINIPDNEIRLYELEAGSLIQKRNWIIIERPL